MADAAAPAGGGAPAAARPRLDETMLAMDVVDTLRHQEGVALKELGQGERDDVLKARLRQIYESQGLEVSDAILDAGIRALKESRFTYTPPPPGLSVTLARMWVARGTVAKVLAVLVVVVIAAFAWQRWQAGTAERAAETARVEIEETLPAALDKAAAAALSEARDSEATAAVEAAVADARAAIGRGDAATARAAIAAVDAVRAELVRTYEIRIVSRPGEPSGVFKVPDVNESARNYYLIVEAVTPGGEILSLPVTSEEDRKSATVAKWGVRVPERVFDAVRRDKEADGIVDDAVVAEKPRGSLKPAWTVPVEAGRILEW
jgi:hypothetical protein